MIDFPASPTVGQTFSAAGVTWTWDGAKWLPSGLAPTVVGGINDNRLINGDMRIDQRNGGAAGNAISTYTVDRWNFSASQSGKFTWQRNINGITGPAGFVYYFGFQTSTAYALLAADTFSFWQAIEGDMVTDFSWGTVNAQPVTLSFWAYSNQAGTFSGSIRNNALNRAYPFSYSLSASAWTKVVVTIPGDTGGTWVLQGNGVGMYVTFDLGNGANGRAPAGAWSAGNICGANGAVSIVSTLNATFYLTGVKLEIGSVATPYNRQSLAKSMADCQRYYSVLNFWMGAYSGASGNFGQTITYPASMRAAPTITGSVFSYLNASGFNPYTVSNVNAAIYCSSTATGQTSIQCTLVLSAEL